MKSLIIVLIALSSIPALAGSRSCQVIEGEDSGVSLSFEGQTAVLEGQRLGCGQIPVSFSTIREIEGAQMAIAYSCSEQGGGIGANDQERVFVYTEGFGWLAQSSDRHYAKVGEAIYRCAE